MKVKGWLPVFSNGGCISRMMTLVPSFAKRDVTAAPIPLDPPVMTTSSFVESHLEAAVNALR
jgi:hypothetical protein